MPMKARMTAKDYLASLNQWELEKVCSLMKKPDFYMFVAEPCQDLYRNARFADECHAVGVPPEYTSSAEAIHYLAVAIAKQLKGDA